MITFSSFKPLLLSDANREGVAFIPCDGEPHPRKVFVIQRPKRSFLWLSGPEAFTLIEDPKILALPCLFLENPSLLVDPHSLCTGVPPVGSLCCTEDGRSLYFRRRVLDIEDSAQTSPCWHFTAWKIVSCENPKVKIFCRGRLGKVENDANGWRSYNLR